MSRLMIVEVPSYTSEFKGIREVQELVRCGECKHWCKGDEIYGICCRCPNTRQMRYDDFCSYGSRSEKPNNSKERSRE